MEQAMRVEDDPAQEAPVVLVSRAAIPVPEDTLLKPPITKTDASFPLRSDRTRKMEEKERKQRRIQVFQGYVAEVASV